MDVGEEVTETGWPSTMNPAATRCSFEIDWTETRLFEFRIQ